MELTLTSDTTSLNYWLTWKFLLCAIWVFTSMIIASYLIWKYEESGNTKTYKMVTQQERTWFQYDCEAWMPCIKGIHPVWLMAFRIISFCLLLAAGVADVATHGTDLFFYYTQWTLSLATFYFAFGSLLSVYGCFKHHKTFHVGVDQDLFLPLTHKEETTSQQERSHFLLTAGFWGYTFQIIFQMTAGAVMLTDSVYWIVIVPFLTIVGYEMGFLTVVAHSLNLVLLLGDTALNSLVTFDIVLIISCVLLLLDMSFYNVSEFYELHKCLETILISAFPLVPNFILPTTDCFLRPLRVDSSCLCCNLVALPVSRLIYRICSPMVLTGGVITSSMLQYLFVSCETKVLHIVSMVSTFISNFEVTFYSECIFIEVTTTKCNTWHTYSNNSGSLNDAFPLC